MNCDPEPPFITDGDMQALAPLLPDLQKLANKESNCAALLPVAEGDNIMDAFLEALLALFLECQADKGGNASDLAWLPSTFAARKPSGFAAGKQTLPLDVEDIVSAFRTHKTIRTLILDWTPWQSGDPSEPHPKTASFPLRSYFSLKGLQNLQHFTVSSRVLKAALMEPSSGSFAHMLPKSLKMLFISGDCEDWQIAALHDLVRGKHLPNLSRVGVGKIVGWGDLLLECHREMRAAEIEFLINP
ncbi:hypothetical protein J3459_020130 [Metarhizium acridum]|nr:hypothetical protein J3459_020130 [Metarhizium acridum]